MADSDLVTPHTFAKIKGVDVKAVNKAIRSGRISYVLVDGKKRLNPEKALKEWDANTNPSLQRTKLQSTPNAHKPKQQDSIGDESSIAGTYQKSRALREAYAARIEKLKYEEIAGSLVKAEEVERAAFEIGRKVRDLIMNIPERLAPILASESDPHKISQLLKRELTDSLEELTRDAE